MAGFLNALSFAIPVGQTLGPELQIAARERQRESSEAAFDRLLDQAGGPELDPFRQYRKAGATPAQTTSAMSGEIGKDIMQQYSVHRMSEIMQGPDFNQNLKTAAGEGLIPWQTVLTYLKEPTKAPPVLPEDLRNNAQQWLASNPKIDQQTRDYVQGAIDSNNYGALKEINDHVIPPYQGSTLYSTRGFTMTGTDADGVPFVTRFGEGSRGQPAYEQTLGPRYADGSPVPRDKMKGARYTGVVPDSGYGAYSTGEAPPPDYGATEEESPADTGGAPPPPYGGGGGRSAIPPPPSTDFGGAPSGGRVLTFGHLGEGEKKTALNIRALQPQLRSLEADMYVVQPKWPTDLMSRVFNKWMAQHFDYLPGTDANAAGRYEAKKFMDSEAKDPDYQKLIKDPDLAYTMSELITVDAVASIALMASAGSRAQGLLEAFKGHIMEPNGNWGSIMTNIASLDAPNGPYRSTLRAMRVRSTTPDPPDVSPAARARARNRGSSAAPPDVNKADEDFMSRFYRH